MSRFCRTSDRRVHKSSAHAHAYHYYCSAERAGFALLMPASCYAHACARTAQNRSLESLMCELRAGSTRALLSAHARPFGAISVHCAAQNWGSAQSVCERASSRKSSLGSGRRVDQLCERVGEFVIR